MDLQVIGYGVELEKRTMQSDKFSSQRRTMITLHQPSKFTEAETPVNVPASLQLQQSVRSICPQKY